MGAIISCEAVGARVYPAMEGVMSLRSLLPIGRERALSRTEKYPLMDLHREIDRLFDDFSRGFPALGSAFGMGGQPSELMPSVDVVEGDKDIEVTAELPGLEEKDVKINVADNVLTISGEKSASREDKDKNYRVVERSYGAFSRSMELPPGVNPDQIKASISKGVLTVTIPKPAPSQTKTIPVKSAA